MFWAVMWGAIQSVAVTKATANSPDKIPAVGLKLLSPCKLFYKEIRP